jgi:hypothetical protein
LGHTATKEEGEKEGRNNTHAVAIERAETRRNGLALS